jgi:CRP-like cAMP-binding protein
MYIVISGSINLISHDPVTNEKQVEVLNSGSVFGEESLFLNQPYKSSAKTEGFCELYELTSDDFDVVMATHPESHRRYFFDQLSTVPTRPSQHECVFLFPLRIPASIF